MIRDSLLGAAFALAAAGGMRQRLAAVAGAMLAVCVAIALLAVAVLLMALRGAL